jgi:hypothetical protein
VRDVFDKRLGAGLHKSSDAKDSLSFLAHGPSVVSHRQQTIIHHKSKTDFNLHFAIDEPTLPNCSTRKAGKSALHAVPCTLTTLLLVHLMNRFSDLLVHFIIHRPKERGTSAGAVPLSFLRRKGQKLEPYHRRIKGSYQLISIYFFSILITTVLPA